MRSLLARAVRLALPSVLVGLASCSAPGAPPRAGAASSAPARAAGPVVWTTTLDRDHPLVGRIWSARSAGFAPEADVLAALHGYVLLGEKHDNRDHHALQARMLRAMVAAGRTPVVAFEMFDTDDQAAIDASRRDHPRDAAALAAAVSWEKSGWPPWSDYEPIARVALDHDLRIVATGLPRSRMRALTRPAAGRDADGGAVEAPIDEGVALTHAQEESLREELRESHCGHLPEAHLGAMIRFQRVRDAAMATALTKAASGSPADAVLVAGTGHTRRDRGAGADLAARDPQRALVSIAFAEVEKGKDDPRAYAARWNTSSLPFDYVWFTPRATDEDPCAAFAH
ncbi:MAG: putative Lipoprotein [Labilithrix sp.]|nr:putative Lipoprotein [Labilithrix sp.]